MIRPLDILVTDAHELAGMGAVRSLGRAGHHVTAAWPSTVGSEPMNRPAVAWSRFCRGTLASPDPWREHAAFAQWLRERLEAGSFDVILPISEASIVALSGLRESGSTDERAPLLLLPSEAALRFTLSKVESTRRAIELGIRSPRTVFVDSLADFPESDLTDRLTRLRYPCVVKLDNWLMPDGIYQRGRGWTVASAEEAFGVLGQHARQPRGAIVQEAIPGHGEGAFLLRYRGRTHLRFAHRRLHEVPWTGGQSSLRESITGEDLLENAERLLDSMDYQGAAMIEFRRGAHDGQPYFLEINGRLWGSLALALHARADFPRALLECHVNGEPSPTRSERRVGLRCRNIFPGELLYLRSILRSQAPPAGPPPPSRAAAIGELIRLTVDPRVRHDYLWLNDPLPGLVQTGRTTAFLLRGAARRIRARLLKIGDRRRVSRLLAEHRGRRSRPRYFDSPLRRILFVCYGNICRSPFAELYWNARRAAFEEPNGSSGGGARLEGPIASSAGVYFASGRTTPDRIAEVARRWGIDLRHHRSRTLETSAVEEADAIFVMDSSNYRDLISRYPDVRSKTWLLGPFAEHGFAVIEDPYGMAPDKASDCYDRLVRALDGLYEQIGADRAVETSEHVSYGDSGAHV